MRRVYEDFWRDLPRDAQPWRFPWRRELLLGHLRPGMRWLDLGCGAGQFTALAGNGIGVDVAEAALERAREADPGGDFRRVGSDGVLPVGHGEVDLVWCSETLEHLADALGALQECRRVLVAGGRVVVTTPAHPLWRRVAVALVAFDRHFDPQGQHLRFFTRRSLRRMLEDAGFAVERLTTRHGTLVAVGRRA